MTSFPQPHVCCLCGAPATRWSGHDIWRGLPPRNTGVNFICVECDHGNNWFDYDGEPLEQDEDGRWHERKP